MPVVLPSRILSMTLALILSLVLLNPGTLLAQEGVLDAVDTAPDAPILLFPADGARTTGSSHPPLGVPTLSWQPVAGATKYQVQVSGSSGFASLLVDRETAFTSYISRIALGNGTFFWRVRAATGTGSRAIWGPYSDPYSFEIDWSDGDTLAPVLLSPPQDAVRAAFGRDDFSWMPVAGAATYRLQISTNDSFSDIVYTAISLNAHHTPQKRLQNNEYYWRVTPIDNQGNTGTPSETWRFFFSWDHAPELLGPDDNAEMAFVPRFSWTAVEAAREYRLQVSSQDSFVSFDQIITRNTDHTPVKEFSNDQDYFWRVQAVDAEGTASPWSEIRRFRAKWNFKPQLLSPANNSIKLAYPFFSWAPVPAAQRYQIQIANNNAFSNPKIVDTTLFNVTNYTQPQWSSAELDKAYYWQVRAIDAQGNFTPWSEVWSFQFSLETAPNLVYPLPYYTPDVANVPVHGDRSMGSPLFIWDTAHSVVLAPSFLPSPADRYRLEVDDDPNFGSPNFVIETTGVAAAPTDTHPFTDLQEGTFYHWRVRAYRDNQPIGGLLTWTTRYASAASELPLAPAASPIYPPDGFEAVEMPPVLGWLPVAGAQHYQVQISRDPGFTKLVDEAKAHYVNYVPWQGRPDPMPFGAYWWRVQARDASNNPIGDWSPPSRFNLSVDLAIGNHYDFPAPPNLAEDESGRALVAGSSQKGQETYELDDLYVIVDRRADDSYNQHWVIAFTSGAKISDTVQYALYFDTDHIAGSGAGSDPRANNAITTDPLYRPEYVLYVDKAAGAISGHFYRWTGNTWAPSQNLTAIGGRIEYDEDLQSIQILLPYTALGSANTDWVGSLALAVYSLNGANLVQDSIPEQGTTLNDPVFVSNMLMPLYPFDTPLTNPIVHYDMPPIRWRMPAYGTDGYQVQVARDTQFTDLVETWESYETQTSSFFTLIPSAFQSKNAYTNNESYYWRVRMRHERYQPGNSAYDYGPWSPAMRFKLDSRQVGNPRISTGVNAFMTPTFIWDRVEGAAGYTIQIDDDSNFSSPVLTQATDANSFTPTDVSNSLLPGTQYFWRVVMRRSSNVLGQWSAPMSFTKSSVAPVLLSPAVDAALTGQPTFQWTTILTPTEEPRLAAPVYRIQVSQDLNFSSTKINETTQATSYTPAKGKGLADGTWYWRVALVDANNRVGPYSPPQRFVKEYPLPVPLSPLPGSTAFTTPTFEWAPIDGAAYYRIEYADNPNFNRSTSATVDLTRFTPLTTLSYGAYYWRVQMFDADRNPGRILQGQFSLGRPIFLPSVMK